MKDRVPTYPGRVTLTPVDGQDNTYDMVRADEPTETGTALSKANLLSDDTAAAIGLTDTDAATVNAALAALQSAIASAQSVVSELQTAVGSKAEQADMETAQSDIEDLQTLTAALGNCEVVTGSYTPTYTQSESSNFYTYTSTASVTFAHKPMLFFVLYQSSTYGSRNYNTLSYWCPSRTSLIFSSVTYSWTTSGGSSYSNTVSADASIDSTGKVLTLTSTAKGQKLGVPTGGWGCQGGNTATYLALLDCND